MRLGTTSRPLVGATVKPASAAVFKRLGFKTRKVSTYCAPSTEEEITETVPTVQSGNKFYAPAPGNPNVILEYDEPPVKSRVKGRFDLKAVFLLTFGCCLILAFFITLVTIV